MARPGVYRVNGSGRDMYMQTMNSKGKFQFQGILRYSPNLSVQHPFTKHEYSKQEKKFARNRNRVLSDITSRLTTDSFGVKRSKSENRHPVGHFLPCIKAKGIYHGKNVIRKLNFTVNEY